MAKHVDVLVVIEREARCMAGFNPREAAELMEVRTVFIAMQERSDAMEAALKEISDYGKTYSGTDYQSIALHFADIARAAITLATIQREEDGHGN